MQPSMIAAEPAHNFEREKIVWALLLVVISGFSFLAVDAYNASKNGGLAQLALETPLDAHIPFFPGFVYAYLLYYPWVLLPLRVLRTRPAFFRGLGAFAAVQVLSQAVFVLFPSHMERPAVVGAGFASELVRMLYRVDAGWNVLPSLHVAHSVLVALLYLQHDRKHAPIVVCGTCAIALSTLLIKQHYLVDVPAGAVLAWLCYWAVERFGNAEVRRLASSDLGEPQC